MTKKDEDPPLSHVHPDKILIMLIVSIVILLFVFVWCANHFAKVDPEISLSRCFLTANLPHNIIIAQTRATLIERIILCESGNCSTAQNPKSTAYGLCQVIDGTWEYVQEKWDMELNRDNYNDQYYACDRLLKEEGTKHWEETRYCWNK